MKYIRSLEEGDHDIQGIESGSKGKFPPIETFVDFWMIAADIRWAANPLPLEFVYLITASAPTAWLSGPRLIVWDDYTRGEGRGPCQMITVGCPVRLHDLMPHRWPVNPIENHQISTAGYEKFDVMGGG